MGDLVVNSGIMRLERHQFPTHLKAQQAARVRAVLLRRLANGVMQKLQGLAEVDLRSLIQNSALHAPCSILCQTRFWHGDQRTGY